MCRDSVTLTCDTEPMEQDIVWDSQPFERTDEHVLRLWFPEPPPEPRAVDLRVGDSVHIDDWTVGNEVVIRETGRYLIDTHGIRRIA